MTELRFEEYRMPAASLGEESCLADIHVNAYIRAGITVSDRIVGEDRRYVGKGMISTLLPYRIQDGYGRERKMRAFRAAVLENGHLRATFLPELGGRLWSLYDKTAGRELLYKNDVFQPANLALRNAWFSGGVEFNVGIKGHNPLTASPLFAAEGKNSSGEPILRMYEYERIRGVVYTVEATLVGDALLLSMRIENTAPTETYMYWWSNIAVPETPGTRVLSPAEDTFFCAYTDGGYFLDKTAMPYLDGRDVTYSESSSRSRDFFFDIAEGEDKWVASVDREGRGLLHVSDPLLKGRKLFVWGTHAGGRHWNDWLTDRAGAYVEIQAGLLKTQMEHFVMPAASTLCWQECYSALTVDPAAVHGDYHAATAAVSALAKERLSLLSPLHFTPASFSHPVQYGSGFGALEERLRGTPISASCVFPADSIGREEGDFLALIENAPLPHHDKNEPYVSYAVGERWLALLEARCDRDFYYENQLGIMRYAAGDIAGAEAAFRASLQKEENAWAIRNLAMLYKNLYADAATAADLLCRARALLPSYRPLAVEWAETLLAAGRAGALAEGYPCLDTAIAGDGRIRMLYAAALVELCRYDEARTILTEELTVADIKEGEYSLSAIWLRLYTAVLAKERRVPPATLTPEEVFAAYPLPTALDFRMH